MVCMPLPIGLLICSIYHYSKTISHGKVLFSNNIPLQLCTLVCVCVFFFFFSMCVTFNIEKLGVLSLLKLILSFLLQIVPVSATIAWKDHLIIHIISRLQESSYSITLFQQGLPLTFQYVIICTLYSEYSAQDIGAQGQHKSRKAFTRTF
ncbi:hypothetical protein PanWU01x14_340740 [Parasponia andersonii]|uniref:Uncharacterized protein n=1 Tax=Parasponia andersonii TaxID=3476 RepID=A0A2P5AEB6_PARAD|nr:hypothetical protein PanWU01x14_340740 [Parasponia andersonii]